MNYKTFVEDTIKELGSLYEPPEGRAIAVRLLQYYCATSEYEHLTEPFRAISTEKYALLQSVVKQLASARPLQYVLNRQQFLGKDFFVEEGVLIPRQETEELVLWAYSHIKENYPRPEDRLTIVDAACGSGVIGISLAAFFPWSTIYAFDISCKAIEITKKNIKLLLHRYNLSTFNYDLLNEHFDKLPFEKADIIVSNPPYITESEKIMMHRNVLEHEPPEALFVPNDNPLLFYRALKKFADRFLSPEGALFMEINERFEGEVVNIFNQADYTRIEVKRDVFDKPRMIKALKIN